MTAKLGLVFVKRCFRDPVLAADVGGRHRRFLFPQNPDYLFFAKP